MSLPDASGDCGQLAGPAGSWAAGGAVLTCDPALTGGGSARTCADAESPAGLGLCRRRGATLPQSPVPSHLQGREHKMRGEGLG